MGKLKWRMIVVLCTLSAGPIVADTGKNRSLGGEIIQVKEHVVGTISRIDGKRLRISEDPDPMGCATSGIKMVDIGERTKLFSGDAPISDNDLQRGDRVIVDAAHHGEILEAIEVRVLDLAVPDHTH
jgi:hypothetical protein